MERKGIITFNGDPLTLAGNEVKVGDKAPDFTVAANDLSPRSLKDYAGKVLLISTAPSLDTGICDMQTRRFNQEAGSLADNIRVLTISCDLPFAQSRWCGAAGVDKLETLSDHKDTSFGLAYGVLIKELRLLARAVFIINVSGRVTYRQLVPEVASEVDFGAAMNALKAAL